MNAQAYLSQEALRARLIAAPPPLPLAPTRSDYDLNPAVRPEGPRTLTPAAVLIPVVARGEPTVLFTTRSQTLPRHAGQVSFPGGCAHAEDDSLVATALREMQEETGIDPAFVAVAGFLTPYETVTAYAVLPVVGLVREGFTMSVNTREVDGVFEVPLAFLIDPANLRQQQREWKGRTRRFYVFQYGAHYIWGATAAILVDLAERLA